MYKIEVRCFGHTVSTFKTTDIEKAKSFYKAHNNDNCVPVAFVNDKMLRFPEADKLFGKLTKKDRFIKNRMVFKTVNSKQKF